MVNDSRRQRIEVEIRHFVCPDHHSAAFTPKQVNDFLQRAPVPVDVVAVQLDRIHPAMRAVHGQVPASADTEIIPFRDNDFQPPVLDRGKFLRSPVGGMIVHDNDIVIEITFLRKCAMDGIGHRSDPVENGDDDGGGHLRLEIRVRADSPESRGNVGSDPLQMLRADFLHLYLDLSVARIHIVELLLSRLAEVRLDLGIEVFSYVDNLIHSQPQIIQGAETPFNIHPFQCLKE